MQRKGSKAEAFVASYLKDEGLVIWGVNVRLGYLELDIVAIDGKQVVVVEVRARRAESFSTPLGSLSPTKRYRLKCAGERLWARHFRYDAAVERLRFDLAAVYDRGSAGLSIEYVRGIAL